QDADPARSEGDGYLPCASRSFSLSKVNSMVASTSLTLPATWEENVAGVTLVSCQRAKRLPWLSMAWISTVLDVGVPVSVALFNQSCSRFKPFWVTVITSSRWFGE